MRLQQVLINLIKNAIKFTQQGFIHVSMAYDVVSQRLIFHIRDSGRGIERANLGKLFKRFGKLKQEDSSVNSEGRGLGLAICEAIVVKNDGLIEVQSMGLGSGTLIIFSMRMVPARESSHISQEQQVEDQQTEQLLS